VLIEANGTHQEAMRVRSDVYAGCAEFKTEGEVYVAQISEIVSACPAN